MIGRAFWTGALKFARMSSTSASTKPTDNTETLRPLELALDSAMNTLQVVIAGRQKRDSLEDLAGGLREDLYDLIHRHRLGGGFLNDIGENPALLGEIRAMVHVAASDPGRPAAPIESHFYPKSFRNPENTRSMRNPCKHAS
jgi:hypothetical protein